MSENLKVIYIINGFFWFYAIFSINFNKTSELKNLEKSVE